MRGVRFIERQIKEADLEVIEAFVIKFVDENEVHVSAYSDRQLLWKFLNCSDNKRLSPLIILLRDNFSGLLREHITDLHGF